MSWAAWQRDVSTLSDATSAEIWLMIVENGTYAFYTNGVQPLNMNDVQSDQLRVTIPTRGT